MPKEGKRAREGRKKKEKQKSNTNGKIRFPSLHTFLLTLSFPYTHFMDEHTFQRVVEAFANSLEVDIVHDNAAYKFHHFRTVPVLSLSVAALSHTLSINVFVVCPAY